MIHYTPLYYNYCSSIIDIIRCYGIFHRYSSARTIDCRNGHKTDGHILPPSVDNILTWELDYDATQRLNYIYFINGIMKGSEVFLADILWEEGLSDCDSVQSWEIFKTKLQGVDKFVSKQSTGHNRKKLLWMTYRAIKAKNKKYMYWKIV